MMLMYLGLLIRALLLLCDDVNIGFLTNIVKGNFGRVFLADKNACNINGKGNARLLLPSGGTLVLQNMGFAPKLGHNLISVSKLADDGGYVSTFGTTFSKVIK
ncbi:hypothetical protein GIB67_037324, partial [Kingdonia uniflora]